MNISMFFKRILLSGLVTASLLSPSLTVTTVSAARSMDDAGHSTADPGNCLLRHQTPTAPIDKAAERQEGKEKDEPIPHESPYFATIQLPYDDPGEAKRSLIESPSFVPPDIVILTTALRI